MGVPSGGGQNLGVAQGEIRISTQDVRRAQREVESASKIMGSALQQLGGAFGIAFGAQMVANIVRSTNAMIEQAAQAERVRNAFDNLATGAGQSAEEMLSAMREASRGMVSDANLVLAANRAMLLGVANTGEELAALLEVARVRGQAMGLTTTQAFNDIVTGIGRMSPLILDNLGIVTGGERIYADYAESIGRTADSLTDAEKKQVLLNKVLKDSEPLIKAAGDEAGSAADSFERYATATDNARKALGDLLKDGSANTTDFWTRMLNGLTAYLNALRQIQQFGLFDNAPPGASNVPSWMTSATPRAAPAPRFDEDQTAAIREWAEGVRAIERQAASDRLDATRQYEEQRTNAIREYGKTIAREAEDFARSRARAEQDFARSIADVRQAAARRELRMAEDLARTIAQARADSAERLADMQEQLDRTLATRRADSAERIAEWEADRSENIAERRKQSTDRLIDLEENFTRERERSMRDSRDRLHQAAGQFDAIAINQEQRRFAREQEERKAAHDEQLTTEQEKLAEAVAQLDAAHRERLEDERKSLDKSIRQAQEAYDRQVEDEREALEKRIAQANEAHARQLEDAREADALRLEDMKADFAERKRREDEDRRTRLNRMATDHNDQLNEMARQHGLRLEQISEQAADERRLLDDEFQKELDALGIRTDAWTEKQKQITDYAIKEFDRWWERITAIANGLAGMGPQPLNPMITPGGWPNLGGGTPTAPVTNNTGGSVTIAPGAIQVYAATGQNPHDIASAVRAQIDQLLQQWMGPYRQ